MGRHVDDDGAAFAKIGRVLGRPHYVAEAQRQFLLHVQYLCDRPTGLFFHGWEFSQDSAAGSGTGHNFANARWARGNTESAITAIKAVIDNVYERGELLNTSFGTGMGHDLQHYKDIPVTSIPYG